MAGNPFDDLIPRPGSVQNAPNDAGVSLDVTPGTTIVPGTAERYPDIPSSLGASSRQPMPGTLVFGQDIKPALPPALPTAPLAQPRTPTSMFEKLGVPQFGAGVGGGYEAIGQGLQHLADGPTVPATVEKAGVFQNVPSRLGTVRQAGSGVADTGRAVAEYGKGIRDAQPPMAVKSYEDIKSFGDFGTYIWESVQQAAGSTVPMLAAGAVAGPAGAVGAGWTMGVGQMRRSVEEERLKVDRAAQTAAAAGNADEAARLSAIAGRLDPRTQAQVIYATGSVIGALDSMFPASMFAKAAEVEIVKKMTAEYVTKAITAAAMRGMATEGVTETLQQGVEVLGIAKAKGAQAAAEYVKALNDNAVEIIDAGLRGAIGGGGMSGAGKAWSLAGERERGQPQPTPEAPNQPQERQEPQLPWPVAQNVETLPAVTPEAQGQETNAIAQFRAMAAEIMAREESESGRDKAGDASSRANPFADLVSLNENQRPPELGSSAADATAPTPVPQPEKSATHDFGRNLQEDNSQTDASRAFWDGRPGRSAPTAAPSAVQPMRVVTPDGSMEIDAVPEVVELADLKRAEGALQPRDRSRSEYAQETRERAASLDPIRLQPSRTSDTGAPIVADDGTVLSGNGRTMSIEHVYRDRELAGIAANYRRSLGKAAEGMREPVLVMRAASLTPQDATRFADLSNRTGIAQMSATERALRDAHAMGLDGIAMYEGGNFDAPQNQRFMRDFMTRAVTAAEMPSVSREGQLTIEGVARMRAAVLAAAYGDADVLSRMLESTDDNVRSITSGLLDAAPRMAQLRAGIASGEVDPDMDPVPALMDAVRTISDLRSRKVSVQQWLAQSDAFGRDPIVEAWVKSFYYDDSNRAKRQEKVALLLNDYAAEAVLHRPVGLFADETTTDDVLNVARRKNDASEDIAPATGPMGEDVPKGRARTGRRPDGAGGQRTSESDDILAAIQSAPAERKDIDDNSEGDWQDTYWEDLANRGTSYEMQQDAAPNFKSGRPIARTALEVQTDKLMGSLANRERELRQERRTPDQIAQTLTDEFGRKNGFAVTPEQIASGKVWWRIGDVMNLEFGSKINWTRDLVDQVQSMLKEDGGNLTYDQIAQRMSVALGRPITRHHIDNVRRNYGLESKRHHVGVSHSSWVRKSNFDLARLYLAGLSTSQIARAFNSIYNTHYDQRAVGRRLTQQLRVSNSGPSVRVSTEGPDVRSVVTEGLTRGLTTHEIASTLTSVSGREYSRNAVIGLIDRMRHAKFRADLAEDLGLDDERQLYEDRMPADVRQNAAEWARKLGLAVPEQSRQTAVNVRQTARDRLGFSWSPRADGRNPRLRVAELRKAGRSFPEIAEAINSEFGEEGGPRLSPGAIKNQWYLMTKAVLRSQGEEPMFAAGGWDARSWLDWIKGKPDVGREDATAERGTGDAGSQEASGQQPGTAEGGSGSNAKPASGGADGVRQSFKVRDFLGRVVDAPPNSFGLRQQYVFLHPPKITWPFVDSAKTTLKNLEHGVPNWAAKAHVSEGEPGVWQVLSFKVRKNQAENGLAPEFLDALQSELGDIRPPEQMTPEAYNAWRAWERQGSRWSNTSIDGYVEHKGEFYSPDMLRRLQTAAARLATSAPSAAERNTARREFNELSDLVDKLPPEDDVLPAIQAYHGSPHDVDQFSTDNIGTGEGFQAYGWGLYFAEAEKVGTNYRREIALKSGATARDLRAAVKKAAPSLPDGIRKQLEHEVLYLTPPTTGEFYLRNKGQFGESKNFTFARDTQLYRDIDAAIKAAIDAKSNAGHLYEVSIDADPSDFLDWDKPLGDQSEKVRGIIEGMKIGSPGSRVVDLLPEIAAAYHKQPFYRLRDPSSNELSRTAAKALNDAGIKGVRYVDQMSRTAGDGSRNIVIFDERLIEIVAKDGKHVTPQQRDDVLAAQALTPSSTSLDLSLEARKERAEEMGFDTSRVWYHGTGAYFNQFNDAVTWVSQDPEVANKMADVAASSGLSSSIIPAYIRGNIATLQQYADESDKTLKKHGHRNRNMTFSALKNLGFDGTADADGVVAIFSNKNIRSVNATFDPSQEASADLIAAVNATPPARNPRVTALQFVTKMKRPVTLPERVVSGVHEALQPFMGMVPPDTAVGVLTKIEPFKGKGNADALMVFAEPDGSLFDVPVVLADVIGNRAIMIPDLGAIGFLRFDLASDLGSGLRGELGHELVHVLRRQNNFAAAAWSRLVAQGNALGVLDSDYRTYLQQIGNAHYNTIPAGKTGRDLYEFAYRSSPPAVLRECLDQEAVAHMLELYVAGQLFDPKMWADPGVAPILDSILDGSIWRVPQGEVYQGEMELMGAAQGSGSAGLDMSPEARKARAEQQGFDTSTVWYHGTRREPFKSFKKSEIGSNFAADDRGFFFINDPKQASEYATSDTVGLPAGGGSVIPVYVKAKNPLIIDDMFLHNEGMQPIGKTDDVISFWDNYQGQIHEWADAAKSDSVVLMDNSYRQNGKNAGQPTMMMVAFDPKSIRSINAEFDPSKTNKSDILAAIQRQPSRGRPTVRRDTDASSMLDKYQDEERRLRASGMAEPEVNRKLSAFWNAISRDNPNAYHIVAEGALSGDVRVDENAMQHMMDVASAPDGSIRSRRSGSRRIAALKIDAPSRYDLIETLVTPNKRFQWRPDHYAFINAAIRSGASSPIEIAEQMAAEFSRDGEIGPFQVSGAIDRMLDNRIKVAELMDERDLKSAADIKSGSLRRPTEAQSRNRVIRGALRDLSETGEKFASRDDIASAISEMTGTDVSARDVSNVAKNGSVRPDVTFGTRSGYRLHDATHDEVDKFVQSLPPASSLTVPAIGEHLRAAGHEISDAVLYKSPDIRDVLSEFAARSGRKNARGAASDDVDNRLTSDLAGVSAKAAAERLRNDGHDGVTESLVEKYRTRLMRDGRLASRRFSWTPEASRAALTQNAQDAADELGTTVSSVHNRKYTLKRMPLADAAELLGVTPAEAQKMMDAPWEQEASAKAVSRSTGGSVTSDRSFIERALNLARRVKQ